MTNTPRAADADARDAAMEVAWREFTAQWRQRRAPAALRERIVAALASFKPRSALGGAGELPNNNAREEPR